MMDIPHEGFNGWFRDFRLVGLLRECSCMAHLTPVVMVIRGLVFHPLFCMVLIRGSYLVCLCVREVPRMTRMVTWQRILEVMLKT